MPNKDPNKPRGRTSAYAYFVQCERAQCVGTPVFTEFSRGCAEKWKKMGEGEKAPFMKKAAEDKMRYDAEMANYIPPKDSGGHKKKGKRGKKQKKDPDAPKRGLSAFMLYSRDERGGIKAANPSWNVGEVAKELGTRWKTVSEDLKSRYQAEALRDKERYMRENAQYKATKPKVQVKKQRRESSSSSSSDDSSSDDSSSDSDSDEE